MRWRWMNPEAGEVYKSEEERKLYWELCAQVWRARRVPPLPFLADLRGTVLAFNPKRCPKWRFRLAEDLVVQLQPKPTVYRENINPRSQQTVEFKGLAIQGTDMPPDAFQEKLSPHVVGVQFTLKAWTEDTQWTWDNTAACSLGPRWLLSRERAHSFERPQLVLDLWQRLIKVLGQVERLDPAMMFQPACLICGRPLTDPASMARWIGPECAGSSSLDVGRFQVFTAESTAA
jgi:hypothetical protein